MKIRILLLLHFMISVILFSCSKNNKPSPPKIPINSHRVYYSGNDLLAGENVIDSIIIPGKDIKIRKYDYYTKYKLKRVFSTKISFGTYEDDYTDTICYNNNIANKLVFKYTENGSNPVFTDSINFDYTSSKLSRLSRNYEDNPFPNFGKLGTYFSYDINNLLYQQTRALVRTNGLSVDVDTIKYFYQANQINKVYVQGANDIKVYNPVVYDTLYFYYGNISNKLKGMANFETLNFYPMINSNQYHIQPQTNFFDMDIINQFTNVNRGFEYYLKMNSIISYVFFKSDKLPTLVQLRTNTSNNLANNLYFSYLYNSNGYPISISASNSPTFNHNQFEKVKLTYY